MRAHLASLVEDWRRAGRQTAVVRYRGVRRHATTYGELAAMAARFHAELALSGVEPGERVVIWAENSAEWMAAFFGCLMRGVLAVPLDVAGSAEFAARVIADVKPRMVVVDAERAAMVGAGARMFALEEDFARLPAKPIWDVNAAVTREAPFQIVFTSGTTSEPKGVVHTHGNVLASLEPIEGEIAKYRKYERVFHPLRFLHCLPLSHVFGQFMGLWVPGVLAAEVHFESSMEPARLVERIKRERVSVLVAVPRALEVLRAYLAARFPGLEEEARGAVGIPLWKRMVRFRRVHRALGWKFWALICGGASLPAELELFWGRMGFALVQGYGMTETAALVTLNHPFHIGRGTIGKPLPGREVRLGADGEIEVRGAMVSTARWSGGKLEQSESEWLATGDLATQDATGELRFAGRKGDAIVTAAGMNVFPADLEAAMVAQGVKTVAVVGCEGANGPEPVAVVLGFDGDDAALEAARDKANAGLAEFQRMRRVLRWPEPVFPYTSSGKLLRRKIAAWAAASLAGFAHDAAGDAVLELVMEVAGRQASRVDDEARLVEDFGLDSLGRVQLQSAVQRFGVEISDVEMARVGTLGELRGLVGVSAKTTATALTQRARRESAGSAAASSQGFEERRSPPGMTKQEEVRPSAVVEHRYPKWVWAWPVEWVRVVFQETAVRGMVRLLAKPRVERAAKLPDGPVIVIANHVTAYDGALVLYGLPWKLRRKMAAAMSGEMLLGYRQGRGSGSKLLDWLMPVAYWLITVLFNVFPLPRLAGFRQSFAHAGAAMDRGYSVMVFPEGHRAEDGRLQKFRAGIGLLAQQAEAAVVPVALVGLGEMRRAGRGWFRSGKLVVRVGEAVPFVRGREPEELAAELEARMRGLLEGWRVEE